MSKSRSMRELWRDMVWQSYDPARWFEDGGRPEPDPDPVDDGEGYIMWVYRHTERSTWAVGYYTPSGEWVNDSDHQTQSEAADRVHYLNGGKPDGSRRETKIVVSSDKESTQDW